jgi:hypothetical protein
MKHEGIILNRPKNFVLPVLDLLPIAKFLVGGVQQLIEVFGQVVGQRRQFPDQLVLERFQFGSMVPVQRFVHFHGFLLQVRRVRGKTLPEVAQQLAQRQIQVPHLVLDVGRHQF